MRNAEFAALAYDMYGQTNAVIGSSAQQNCQKDTYIIIKGGYRDII